MRFTSEQQKELFNYIDGNQMADDEAIAEILGINEEDVVDAMVELNYELCQDCGCWVEDGYGDFIDNDFVCQDCHNIED